MYHFHQQTTEPLGPSSTLGCDESTSMCQMTPSIRARKSHQPVILNVPLMEGLGPDLLFENHFSISGLIFAFLIMLPCSGQARGEVLRQVSSEARRWSYRSHSQKARMVVIRKSHCYFLSVSISLNPPGDSAYPRIIPFPHFIGK
ncbi:hypothetical protein E5676_scaffold778G00640 [Cucumis melo var. makuwa]|uniref:Uncharacterized protein n=1 Tax=Cucumis melo var. makuwa TaxID=1194695 RepID=A0A5D3DBT8_CUCMM|nr:hypothetical protein E6C27_scaffold242G002180 [Cucumis melo var. makuwa]TYK21042.1 hypothetical protein E5676_scaffold778G00640 [Cucumis melo var. makuwa]